MRRFLLGFGIFAALSGAAAAAEPLAFRGAELRSDGAAERVEIGLSARPPFRLFTLDDPPRIVLDLPETDWSGAAPPSATGLRLVGGLRFGARAGGARVVVDLRRPARILRAHTEPDGAGGRVSLELGPSDAAAFAALAGWPEAARPATAPAPAPAPPPAAEGDGPLLVMIDPGHGGADPGALARGLAEKDLTLDYARALAAELARRPGFRAALTRTGDDYVGLRERVERTRAAGAHALLSLHADALATGEAAGASVFTLSEIASSEEAAALAEGHERGETLAGAAVAAVESDVAKALLDLSRRRTDARSRRMASELVSALEAAAPVLEGRALQSAGFRVLRAPDVPSALVELGFMSSAEDRARLLSEEGRMAAVTALAEGLAAWARTEEGAEFDAWRAAQPPD
ncbi:MAG: N-acetylmuramoyl-L-alanine amidase [Pikeienuella sp.]|uniref:N-acetylmuramoyl-L-alanine amidase n=1 Tax=Pikeienuella sp. TaxID=2831957 RepID=UPI0039195CC5